MTNRINGQVSSDSRPTPERRSTLARSETDLSVPRTITVLRNVEFIKKYDEDLNTTNLF